MKEFPSQPENLSNETIPKEIEGHLTASEAERFRALKRDIRVMLTPPGIWSAAFDEGLNKAIRHVDVLATMIRQYKEARVTKDETKRKEALAKRKTVMERNLTSRGLWPDTFAPWLESAPVDSLEKLSELLEQCASLCDEADVRSVANMLRSAMASKDRKKK